MSAAKKVTLLILVLTFLAVFGWIVDHLDSPTLHDPLLTSEIDQFRALAQACYTPDNPACDELAASLDASQALIPVGEFRQGSLSGAADEQPQRRITLDAFKLDRFEVTHVQYRRFLLASAIKPPRYWNGTDYPPGAADIPVVGVSWTQAHDYCAWIGKRLPSEAEWEKACHGPAGSTYPWGERWQPRSANLGLKQASAWPQRIDDGWQFLLNMGKGNAGPSPQSVGSHLQDTSGYGIFDLGGNVSEWVEDAYASDAYAQTPAENPLITEPPWSHALRGGAWFDRLGTQALASDLSRCSKRNASHSADDPRVGFRCASDPGKKQLP